MKLLKDMINQLPDLKKPPPL